jgi:hypothetical protein
MRQTVESEVSTAPVLNLGSATDAGLSQFQTKLYASALATHEEHKKAFSCGSFHSNGTSFFAVTRLHVKVRSQASLFHGSRDLRDSIFRSPLPKTSPRNMTYSLLNLHFDSAAKFSASRYLCSTNFTCFLCSSSDRLNINTSVRSQRLFVVKAVLRAFPYKLVQM